MVRKGVLAVGLALLASGCLGKDDSVKADAVTATFYQEVAAKQYQAIYDAAAPDLTGTTSAGDFLSFMQGIDARLGACGAPVKRFDIHTNATQGAFFRTQGYTRICAKGVASESVTVVLRDGVAKIAGFNSTL